LSLLRRSYLALLPLLRDLDIVQFHTQDAFFPQLQKRHTLQFTLYS
jgi:hypothetical protein